MARLKGQVVVSVGSFLHRPVFGCPEVQKQANHIEWSGFGRFLDEKTTVLHGFRGFWGQASFNAYHSWIPIWRSLATRS